jgi:hypothetical protein
MPHELFPGVLFSHALVHEDQRKVLCITWLEKVLQVLALVAPRLSPLRPQTVLALAK